MWFPLSSIAILFVTYAQQESLRPFPQSVNMVFRPDRPHQIFRNIDENSPFPLRHFENEIPNEINLRTPPFILPRDIRARTEYTCDCEVILNDIDLGYDHVPR